MRGKPEKGKLKLGITPFPEGDQLGMAQVLVSNRKARGKSEIRWKMADGFDGYSMDDLQDDDGVFKDIEIRKKKISCEFDPPADAPADKEYNYTLVIKDRDGKYYNTTEPEGTGPSGGKPVIRN